MSMITELVERLKDFANEYVFTDTDTMGVLNDAAFVIEELSAKLQAANMERSSQYYNGGWIPVERELPELNKPLLVTAYHRVCYAHMISESGNYGYPVFRLHELKDSDRGWVQETISHEPYSKGRIDAWMYIDIPQPYKGESEE